MIIGEESIHKQGAFTRKEVEEKFKTPIALTSEAKPYYSYYPFSENDDIGVIIPEVLRAIITILLDRRRKGLAIFERRTYELDDVLRTIHPMWDILSIEHRNNLIAKVLDVINVLRTRYDKFREQIEEIQSKETESKVAVSNLIQICQSILKEEEGKQRLV